MSLLFKWSKGKALVEAEVGDESRDLEGTMVAIVVALVSTMMILLMVDMETINVFPLSFFFNLQY